MSKISDKLYMAYLDNELSAAELAGMEKDLPQQELTRLEQEIFFEKELAGILGKSSSQRGRVSGQELKGSTHR